MKWDVLKEKKVRVLIKNPLPNGSGRNESYVGIFIDVADDFLLLDTIEHNNKLSTVMLKLEIILSIWVYKSGQ